MTDEILYTGQLKSEDLFLLIADCRIPENDKRILFLAENMPTRVIDPQKRQELLEFTFYSAKLSFANYTSGRIFHPDWELRWEHRSGTAHIVYLGQQSPAVQWAMDHYRMKVKAQDNPIDHDGQNKLIDLQTLDKRKRCYYLFGTRLRDEDVRLIGSPARVGDFAELRIHRILRYPAPGSMSNDGKGRVKLTVREYLDRERGQVQFFRFQELKEAIEGKDEACDESL